MLIQIGTNLYNDVGDFERGADGADRLGPPRATSMGWLAPGGRPPRRGDELRPGDGARCVSRLDRRLADLRHRAGVGRCRHRIHRRSATHRLHRFGEFFVFVFFGLVATVGSSFLQTGRFSWASVAAGAMVGALAAAVLVVNNYRDLESDRRSAKITLAVHIGYAASRIEFAALVLLPFATLPLLAFLTGTGTRMLLPRASLPIATSSCGPRPGADQPRAEPASQAYRTARIRLRLAGVCGADALTRTE